MYEIKFNPLFNRWEVFHTKRSQIRAKKRQPVFVAASLVEAAEYIRRCKA